MSMSKYKKKQINKSKNLSEEDDIFIDDEHEEGEQSA